VCPNVCRFLDPPQSAKSNFIRLLNNNIFVSRSKYGEPF
jgi:hypothetical protein